MTWFTDQYFISITQMSPNNPFFIDKKHFLVQTLDFYPSFMKNTIFVNFGGKFSRAIFTVFPYIGGQGWWWYPPIGPQLQFA